MSSAATTKPSRRRPDVAGQHVLRAGVAVLPRRESRKGCSRRRASSAWRNWPAGASTSARRAAACPTWCRRLLDANRIDASTHHAAAATADARGGRPARRQARCHRAGLGARIADGADAAADARRATVRLRAGRGLHAPLRLPVGRDAAARRGRPGRRPAAGRRAPGRPDRHAGRPRGPAPGAGAAVRAGRAAGPWRARLVPAQGRLSERPRRRTRTRCRSAALLPQRRALAAALPAVLAGQPDRPHVAGAAVDRRGADPAVARRAAADRVAHPLARLPLVRASCAASKSATGARPAAELLRRTGRHRSQGGAACRCRCRYTDELYCTEEPHPVRAMALQSAAGRSQGRHRAPAGA